MIAEGSASWIVGVAGGTASGKTTFAAALAAALAPHATVIPQDAYYRDRSHLSAQARDQLNFDHPDAIETSLLVDHVRALRSGFAVEIPSYDFSSHSRRMPGRLISPKPLVIVEGMLVLHDETLRSLVDLAVFVEAPDDLRLARRIARDVRERGRTVDGVIEQYFGSVKPMHERFVVPQLRHAELVIDGRDDAELRAAVDGVLRRLAARDAGPMPAAVRGRPA